MRAQLLIAPVFFLASIIAYSQTRQTAPTIDYEAVRLTKVVKAVRTSEHIVIDGLPNEAAWQTANVATDFLQWEPKPGAPARDRTEVRFLYDDENLYVVATCFDSDPGHLVVNELKEDFAGTESDGFTISIDALHDRRSGFIFGTNPAGARRDMQVSNDGAQSNQDWDGVWSVKTSVNAEGWIAEYAIPFKTLRFRELEQQEWGVNMLRRVRRTNEDSFWSPVPRRYRGTRMSVQGLLTGIEGIHQGRNLKVKPFVSSEFTDTASASGNVQKNKFGGGVDLKYGLTPSLTMDMTYRTDFSQVEVDQQQVNLTRFNLFFPEKREFFLENAATFGLNGGPADNVIPFFSRSIGLSSSGTPIPIIGGTRVSGRVNRYDMGFIAMKTERHGATPSNNFVVGRVKRNLLKNSWIGATVTNRDSTVRRDFNRVYGADARFQFFDKLELEGYVIRSSTPGKSGKDQARKFEVGWTDDDLVLGAGYEIVEANFNPEVGFVRRKDNTKYSANVLKRIRPKGSRHFRSFNFSSRFDYFESGLGKVETRVHSLQFDMQFQDNSTFLVNTIDTFDRLVKPFDIRTSLAIARGDYGYRAQTVNYSSDKSKTIAGNGSLIFGEFWNGHRLTTTGGLSLKPSYKLNADLSYTRNRVTLPNGTFTTNLFAPRVLYAFSSRTFLNAFIQYNSDTHQVSSNVRFNITYRPLSDVYLVWNDRRDVQTGKRLERAFIVKVTKLLNF